MPPARSHSDCSTQFTPDVAFGTSATDRASAFTKAATQRTARTSSGITKCSIASGGFSRTCSRQNFCAAAHGRMTLP